MWEWPKSSPVHTRTNPPSLLTGLYAMRLNEKLGIEIKGEGKPEIGYPGDKYWSGISLAMICPWI